jgi:hypothetical protein
LDQSISLCRQTKVVWINQSAFAAKAKSFGSIDPPLPAKQSDEVDWFPLPATQSDRFDRSALPTKAKVACAAATADACCTKAVHPREQQLHQTVHRLATRAARCYHWVRYPEPMQYGSEHALKLCHRLEPSGASVGTFICRSVSTAMRRRAQQIQREAARLVPDVFSCDDLPADYIAPAPNSAPSSSSATTN